MLAALEVKHGEETVGLDVCGVGLEAAQAEL
jgi:hypothetical protein